MARITNFLKLFLPGEDEYYNVEKDQNENFEKIDTKLKEWDTGKEPAITKKSGFNLDKTNLTENDSNKLFTAKGALDLFNTLTTNFTNAVNSAKEYFRTELVKKIDKTSKSDAVNSASSETIATSKAVKTAYDKAEAAIPIIDNTVVTNLNTVKGTKFFMVNGGDAIGMPTDSSFSSGDFNVAQFDSQEQRVQIIFNNYGVPFLRTNDVSRNQENYENAWGEWYRIWNEINFNPDNKLNISEAWKQQVKPIGNSTTPIDLNTITEAGEYYSGSVKYKWANLPNGSYNYFHLTVESIGMYYKIQTLRSYNNVEFRRINESLDSWNWSPWVRIDAPSINWGNLPDKPSVFPAATHTHSWASLTGKPAFINVVDSTSTTDFATPRSVKLAYDRGSAALTEANKKLPLTGGTVSGNLTVTGTILANGNITAFSDRRLKKDIHKIENALEKIKNVSGYTFTMNGEKRTGVIAQEIQKVLPEIVSKQTFEDKEYLAVAYGNMAGLFIEAIKELKNEIDILKKKVGA